MRKLQMPAELGWTILRNPGLFLSPDASSAGSVAANGELYPAPAAGTTSRRNRRRLRAWHPGPSGNPAGQRSQSWRNPNWGRRRVVLLPNREERRGREGENALVGNACDSPRRSGGTCGSITTPYMFNRRATPFLILSPPTWFINPSTFSISFRASQFLGQWPYNVERSDSNRSS